MVAAPGHLIDRLAECTAAERAEVLEGLSDSECRALEADLFAADALDLLDWTEQHRTIAGEPLRPSALPWLRDLYLDTSPEVWVMKASQVFISEWMVSAALWVADTGHGGRGNALYVFPTERQMGDFVHARVDTAIQQSDYLSARVGSGVDNVGLKRFGRGHLYFRGSEARRQLLTIDADCLLFDEVDEYSAATVPTARKRLNSARTPWVRAGSTPKFPASGIAPVYQASTRRHYFLRCEACGERQDLRFPENLTEDGRLVCRRCAAPLDCTSEGEWVAEDAAADVEGYHVSRLYSPRADLAALAKLGYAILAGHVSDPTAIQEFHNQDLGVPHAPAGGSLSDDVLNACLADYGMPATVETGPVVMGVDVGAVLHAWVKGPAPAPPVPGTTRLLFADTLRSWDDLDLLMRRYDVARCVIDAMPEDHKTAAFADRWPGRVYRCFYPSVSQWRHDEPAIWKPDDRVVLAHRTRSLDATFDRFYQRLEQLPREAPYHHGVYAQLKAPVRILTEDADGRMVARYDEGNAADHYAHAANYAELARSTARVPRPHESHTYTIGTASVQTSRASVLFGKGIDPRLPRAEQERIAEERRLLMEAQQRPRSTHEPVASGGADETHTQFLARIRSRTND